MAYSMIVVQIVQGEIFLLFDVQMFCDDAVYHCFSGDSPLQQTIRSSGSTCFLTLTSMLKVVSSPSKSVTLMVTSFLPGLVAESLNDLPLCAMAVISCN